MKPIDSDALGFLNKALGISGRGVPVTELADGVLDQSLDVNPIVRRGRTLGATEGIFLVRMRNNHAAANSTTSEVNPYIAAQFANPPFPSPIPAQFDLWALEVSVSVGAGSASISGALFVNFPPTIQGIGLNDGGGGQGAVITSNCIAFFDTIVDENVIFATNAATGSPRKKLGMRIPRSTLTQFVWATTSTGVAIYDLLLLVGLFPVSLGQDGIV